MSLNTFTWCSQESSISTFNEGFEVILAQKPLSLIVLSCSANNYEESSINQLLTRANIPICGGIYPNVFLGEELFEQGIIFIGLPFVVDNAIFENIDQQVEQFNELINNNQTLQTNKNTLMFYDGLMAHTELFIEALHSCLPHNITVVGGGAGSLDFIQHPCVYTNDGLKLGVIQLVALPSDLAVGVGHGWQILEGPFLVSESEGTVIESLNYLDAYSVYQETVEDLSEYRFDQQEFFDIAKHFPFGIESVRGELQVRDPILAHEQSIQCVGNVPINSMVYILRGDKELLLESALTAKNYAKKESKAEICIVFDCISRKHYLEDSFKDELKALTSDNGAKVSFGVLSLGEIANDGSGAIKLLNKSTVIGCM